VTKSDGDELAGDGDGDGDGDGELTSTAVYPSLPPSPAAALCLT
jgi:hypothetical protein